MSLNRTKIEWTDYSWNPITGCLHNCWYCYAKKLFTRFHKSFKPTFYPERLQELKKLKRPAKIFVCSVADIFAKWTEEDWRDAVLRVIQKPEYKHLTFQLLTKNPERIDKRHIFPNNIWIGTTVTGIDDLANIDEIKKVKCGIRFVSFEPLLGPVFNTFYPGEMLRDIDWVIIGKLSGSKRIKLQKRWVLEILSYCREFYIPVFIKDNVRWNKKIQRFPN